MNILKILSTALIFVMLTMTSCINDAPKTDEKIFEIAGNQTLDSRKKLDPLTRKFAKLGPYNIFRSRHYLIRSRQSTEEMKIVCKRMDEFYELLWEWSGFTDYKPAHHPPLQVTMFSNSQQLKQIARMGPMYVSDFKIMFIYATPGKPGAFYHEGVHQAFDLVVPTAQMPLWFNEGMAICVGMASKRGSENYDPTKIHPRYIKSMSKLAKRGVKQFSKAEAHARGWAIIFWMRNFDKSDTLDRWIDLVAKSQPIPKNELRDIEKKVVRWLQKENTKRQ